MGRTTAAAEVSPELGLEFYANLFPQAVPLSTLKLHALITTRSEAHITKLESLI